MWSLNRHVMQIDTKANYRASVKNRDLSYMVGMCATDWKEGYYNNEALLGCYSANWGATGFTRHTLVFTLRSIKTQLPASAGFYKSGGEAKSGRDLYLLDSNDDENEANQPHTHLEGREDWLRVFDDGGHTLTQRMDYLQHLDDAMERVRKLETAAAMIGASPGQDASMGVGAATTPMDVDGGAGRLVMVNPSTASIASTTATSTGTANG
ncbi:unnamed protein product [Vitrella brassicaformis CCMP3155]|uniref:Uncharacterized protein n=1 Tax=Vitrella brassicaformis (strain CCMP3155) TaxID=1169540 RepID=A0A0G4G3T4_VITBC|nr:unnamed protein product [Vitrella brassicaformis CCMP3155]|eukprot:CEM22984.1 unnamed protein product [Vitrella brassicaformis CCMP3155]